MHEINLRVSFDSQKPTSDEKFDNYQILISASAENQAIKRRRRRIIWVELDILQVEKIKEIQAYIH